MDTYEKKYNEALERARNLYPSVHEHNKKMLEQIFPELRESEDERMTRVIGLALTDVPEERFTSLGTTLKDCLAYLEKQKEHTPVQSEDEREYVRILKSIVSDFIRDKKPEDVAYYQKIYDWLDGRHVEVKEQKPKEPDWCHHKVDLSGCSEEYIKAYYDGWNNCNQQHSQCKAEQKPADLSEMMVHKEPYIALVPTPMVADEQKPTEKQDYSGLTDLERAIHRGFLSAGVENVPVTIIKETANECKRIANENANAEWNEEDKSFYDSIMCEVVKEGMHPTPAQANWFKLLPERFNLKPHRKPSKEQEEPKYYQHFDPDC